MITIDYAMVLAACRTQNGTGMGELMQFQSCWRE